MIDSTDLIFVTERYGAPLAGCAAPRSEGGQINPHVSRFLLPDRETFVDVFHVKPIYYLHKNGTWRPMKEVTKHHGNSELILNKNWKYIDQYFLTYLSLRQHELGQELLIDYGEFAYGMQPRHMVFASSLVVYPVPSVTQDGGLYEVPNGGSGQTPWTACRNASSANNTSIAAQFYNYAAGNDNGYGTVAISRSIFPFDTSALTSGAVVSAATLSLWCVSWNICGTNTGAEASVAAYASNQASLTGITGTDYATLGTIPFSPTNSNMYSGSTTGYSDLVLNSTGIAAVSKTSVTRLGTRCGYDVDNIVPPTTTYYGGGVDSANVYFSAQTGTANDPRLTVTYTLPAPAGGAFLLNMLS